MNQLVKILVMIGSAASIGHGHAGGDEHLVADEGGFSDRLSAGFAISGSPIWDVSAFAVVSLCYIIPLVMVVNSKAVV